MAAVLRNVCKVLSEETRLRIAWALAEEDLCVCELSDALCVSQSTLSNHLAKMRDLGIVEARKDGTWTYYAIAEELRDALNTVFEAFDRDLAEDATLREDHERLNARLAMRVDGKCIRSYGQL